MLTRLYIDNFRCFEKFEWRPERKQLILGRNGTGKTSLIEVLHAIHATAVDGERVEKWFKLNRRTRWLQQREQVFEIEAELDGETFVYRLVLEPRGNPRHLRVRSETVHLQGEPLLTFVDGEVLIRPNVPGHGGGYQLDQNRLALPTIGEGNARSLVEFRKWLNRIECWRINPIVMESRAETEVVTPRVDLANFAAWYRHHVQARPKENIAFLQDLRESVDGFDQFVLADAGESVRILYAEFLRGDKTVRMGFGELSDGQRCLVCLYAIMHFVIAKGGTVFIDEPDNFISLREIQPWLVAIDDMVSESKGQVFLISHHPEIMNQWAPAHGVQFVRDGAGPVRIEKFQSNPEYSLSPGELVARGWERE